MQISDQLNKLYLNLEESKKILRDLQITAKTYNDGINYLILEIQSTIYRKSLYPLYNNNKRIRIEFSKHLVDYLKKYVDEKTANNYTLYVSFWLKYNKGKKRFVVSYKPNPPIFPYKYEDSARKHYKTCSQICKVLDPLVNKLNLLLPEVGSNPLTFITEEEMQNFNSLWLGIRKSIRTIDHKLALGKAIL